MPVGTIRGWVHGQYFGIDGLWSYNDHVESREWCWRGPERAVFQPLPHNEYIVVVDGKALSAIYQDAQVPEICHGWSRGSDGVYRSHRVPYARRYGSDVGMAFPHHVFLPGYRQFYELFEGGLLLRRTGQPVDRPCILRKRQLKGVDHNSILLMQPRKHQILAVGTSSQLLLLSAQLDLLAKVPLGAVRNLRFDESGERLAVVTSDNRLWILELNPPSGLWNSALASFWTPRADLSPEEFDRLASDWEKTNGRLWWNPTVIFGRR